MVKKGLLSISIVFFLSVLVGCEKESANLNMQNIEKFVSMIEKDAAQAKGNKRITGSWVFKEGKPQFISTVKYPKGKVVLKTELPPSAGGWGKSPDPIQYILYGFAGCFAATFAVIAAGEGIELERLEVTAETWLDIRKMFGVSSDNIMEKVKFTVKTEGASRDQLEKILALTEERCPGIECVTRPIPLEVELST